MHGFYGLLSFSWATIKFIQLGNSRRTELIKKRGIWMADG